MTDKPIYQALEAIYQVASQPRCASGLEEMQDEILTIAAAALGYRCTIVKPMQPSWKPWEWNVS